MKQCFDSAQSLFKSGAVLTAAGILVGGVLVGSSPAATLLVDQNFDSLANGATTVPDATIAKDGSETVLVTNEQSVSPDQSLKITDTSDNPSYHPYIRWDIPDQSNNITQIAFDYRFDNEGVHSPQFYLDIKGENDATSNVQLGRLQFDSTSMRAETNGSNDGTSFGTIAKDGWYHIVIKFPTQGTTATGYEVDWGPVGGTQTQTTDLPFWTSYSTNGDLKLNRLVFTDDGTNPDTVYLDNIQVSVPEPGSLALLTLGGLAMLTRKRRRRTDPQ